MSYPTPPTPLPDRTRNAFRTALAVADFIAKHRHWPRALRASHVPEDEQRLGRWLSRIRNDPGPEPTPSVYSHIIPGWDALQLTTKKLPPAPPALTCQEPGCTRRLYGRGCCRSHYDQYYPPSTRAKYRPWTHDEDLIALDPAISIKSATTYIRRTQAACNRRRAMIRNRHPDRYQEILMEIHESRTVDLQDQVRAELAEFAAEHGYDQGSYAAGSFADEYAAEVTENLLDWPDAAPTYDFSPPRHLRDELEDDITWTGSAKVSDLLAKAAASKR